MKLIEKAEMAAFLMLARCVVGCTAQERAETAHSAVVFACEVAALAPYVPQAISAEKLAEDVATGSANLPVALVRLGMVPAEADKVVDAFNACFAGHGELQPLPPELTPGTTSLRAPPPAYGNRVM